MSCELQSKANDCQLFLEPTIQNTVKNPSAITLEKVDSLGRNFKIISISNLSDLSEQMLATAIKVYKATFAQEPYREHFSDEEAYNAFQYILQKKGDLLFGENQDETICFAGGYIEPGQIYFIEELGVSPEYQRMGLGRKMFEAMQDVIKQKNCSRQEIRTTSRNCKAISLYESCGFVKELGLEIVFQRRQNGQIELDERIYLSKPALENKERFMTLKHLAVVYPSGNATAVVFDQLLDSDRKELNHNIMQTWKKQMSDCPEIEQCCFVTLPKNPDTIARVEMFGGEFCGNATRSAIWLLTNGEDNKGLIEVSGVSRPLEFSVMKGEVKVEMPLPNKASFVRYVDEGVIVELDGITHLVVMDCDKQTPRELIDSLLLSNKYGCAEFPAFGVSYFDTSSGAAQFCVWVKQVDTVFDETACGSGTCSIGIALASEQQSSLEREIIQPSGKVIRTCTEYDNGRIVMSSIAGTVDVLYDGEFKFA